MTDIKGKLIDLTEPAIIVLIILAWMTLTPIIPPLVLVLLISYGGPLLVQGFELIFERHKEWRINVLEFRTDFFYVIVFYFVLKVEDFLFESPFQTFSFKYLHTQNLWPNKMPFLAQVAICFLIFEIGQYWMHRLMHNSVLWKVHAPHHHLTQLNSLKTNVGHPIELFLVCVSFLPLFDMPLEVSCCAFNLMDIIDTFAHANFKGTPPKCFLFSLLR